MIYLFVGLSILAEVCSDGPKTRRAVDRVPQGVHICVGMEGQYPSKNALIIDWKCYKKLLSHNGFTNI